MTGIISTIVIAFKAGMLWFTRWIEIDKEKREKKKKALKKLDKGFEKNSMKTIIDAINDGMNP